MSEAGVVQQLLGTWHIQFTNFPMWLKGEKSHPALTYSVHSRPDQIIDVVTYEYRNQVRGIRGRDRYLGERRFRWRGAGFLCFLTSNWEVAHMSCECDWAIIRFEKSLFSPAGHDIVARQSRVSDSMAKEMISRFREIFPGEKIERLNSSAN
jgi:hypothetical protein